MDSSDRPNRDIIDCSVVVPLYNEASEEAKNLIEDIYVIALKQAGVIGNEEEKFYSMIVDGKLPDNFKGVKKAMNKSQKFVKSDISLKLKRASKQKKAEKKSGETKKEGTEEVEEGELDLIIDDPYAYEE